jgi:hypothetical protein
MSYATFSRLIQINNVFGDYLPPGSQDYPAFRMPVPEMPDDYLRYASITTMGVINDEILESMQCC